MKYDLDHVKLPANGPDRREHHLARYDQDTIEALNLDAA